MFTIEIEDGPSIDTLSPILSIESVYECKWEKGGFSITIVAQSIQFSRNIWSIEKYFNKNSVAGTCKSVVCGQFPIFQTIED